MKKIVKVISSTMLLATSLGSVAESERGQVTAKLSTMGFGIEYNHPMNSVLSVSFGANKFSKNEGVTESNIDYNGGLDWKSLSVIANYHPWQSGLRLRTGTYYNKNKINLNARYIATAEDTIGDVAFTGATVDINGELSFREFAPYIGIGYGSEPIGDNNLSLDIDIGVMQSPVKAQLTGTCTDGVGVPAICEPADFNAALATEQKDLTDAIDGLDLYPVISFGLTY